MFCSEKQKFYPAMSTVCWKSWPYFQSVPSTIRYWNCQLLPASQIVYILRFKSSHHVRKPENTPLRHHRAPGSWRWWAATARPRPSTAVDRPPRCCPSSGGWRQPSLRTPHLTLAMEVVNKKKIRLGKVHLFSTYLPHEAVAEVSNHKEPIGRGCVEFNWFESHLVSDSNDLRFKRFWLSIDLGFKCFVCQLIWDSTDLLVHWFEIQMIHVVNWFEIQWIWLSTDLRFNGFACQMIWDSNGLVVKWFWLSIDLRCKGFACQLMWDSNDLCCQLDIYSNDLCCQLIWNSRLPSKIKLGGSETKLLCETSFKKEILKLKNAAFVRDFLQKWNFEAQKRSFCARLLSKKKLWSSKANLFCKTSFKKEALKLQSEAFLRDFLQKSSFEDQKRSISPRLPSKITCWPHTWPQNSNTF